MNHAVNDMNEPRPAKIYIDFIDPRSNRMKTGFFVNFSRITNKYDEAWLAR